MSSFLINDLESNISGEMIKISKERQNFILGGCTEGLCEFAPFGLPEKSILNPS